MTPLITLGTILFCYMSFWFFVSIIIKRNDIADLAWGLGFILIAWASFLLGDNTSWRAILTNNLVTIWGLRLAFHIFQRLKSKGEDYRYQQWRKDWGAQFYLRSFLQVYVLQGIFLFLIVLPTIFINLSSTNPLNILDVIGVIIWTTGFFFETIADYQLSQFIKNKTNKGKIIQSGLWKFSRHPNYFGEVTQWWGIYLIALNTPYQLISLLGPVTITILILFVSGIPLLEKKSQQKIGWDDYKKRTSIFIPLPPKN